MRQPSFYLWAAFLALVLVVIGLFRIVQGTGLAAQSRDASPDPKGHLPEVLKDTPEYMKINHGMYDNAYTALYEQWLASDDLSESPSKTAPNKAFAPLFGLDVRMSNAGLGGNNALQIDSNPLNSNFAIGTPDDGRTAGVGIYCTTDRGLTWTAQDAPIGQEGPRTRPLLLP